MHDIPLHLYIELFTDKHRFPCCRYSGTDLHELDENLMRSQKASPSVSSKELSTALDGFLEPVAGSAGHGDGLNSVLSSLESLDVKLLGIDVETKRLDLELLSEEIPPIEVQHICETNTEKNDNFTCPKLSELAQATPCNIGIHRDGITAVAVSRDSSTIFSAANSCLKVFSLDEGGKQRRSTHVGELTLSSCMLTADGSTVILSSWDNHIYFYSVVYGRIVGSCPAHDDAVAGLSMAGDRLVSGGWDSTVKVWQVREDSLSEALMELDEHDSEIKCVDLSSDGNIAVSGGEDGSAIVWDLRKESPVALYDDLSEDGAPVECVRLLSSNTSGNRIEFALATGSVIKHMDASRGREVGEVNCGATVSCLETMGSNLISGDGSSVVTEWNLQTREAKYKLDGNCGAISCMGLSAEGKTLVCGFSRPKDNLSVWTL